MSEGANPAKNALTQRESELVVMAIQCLKENCLQIDWEKFATMAEFKTKASANASFGHLVKHKLSTATLDNFYVAYGGGAGPTPRKRKSPVKKAKTPAEGEDANEDTDPVTPPKKKRNKKQAAEGAVKKGVKAETGKKVKKEEDVKEDDDIKREEDVDEEEVQSRADYETLVEHDS